MRTLTKLDMKENTLDKHTTHTILTLPLATQDEKSNHAR